MSRLPQPGSDDGTWGNILNDFLSVSLDSDGTLRPGVVAAGKLSVANSPTTGFVLSYDGTSLAWHDPSSYGVTVHANLSGLASDDHLQYHNDARGDARYFTKTEVNTALATKVDTSDSRLTNARQPIDGSVTTIKMADRNVTPSKLLVAANPTVGQFLTYDGTAFAWSSGSGGGVTAHGQLTGLLNDDHPQYFNQTRGDARYFTQAQVTNALSSKVDTGDSRLSDARAPLDNSVTTTSLQDDSVTAPKIKTAVDAATGQILSYDGAALAWINPAAGGSDPVVGGDLTGTASNAQIGAGVVGTSEIAASSITTALLADGNVTTGKLAANAVTTAVLSNGAVTTTKLSAGAAPTSGQILSYNGSSLTWTSPSAVPATLNDLSDVDTTGAADGNSLVYQSGSWKPVMITSTGGVTAHGALTGLGNDDHTQYFNVTRGDARYYTQAQIDTQLSAKVGSTDSRLSDTRTPTDNTVSTVKLQDAAVATAKLADGSVTSTKLQNGAVGSTALAASAVTTAKLQDSSVTTAKIVATNSPAANQSLTYTAGGFKWATISGGATAASGVSYTPTGTLSSATVQDALTELDGDVMHRSGAETIAGAKTFSGSIIIGSTNVLPALSDNRTPLDNSVNAGKLNTPLDPTDGQILTYDASGTPTLRWMTPDSTISKTTLTGDTTLAISHAGSVVELNSSSATTVTVPTNSSAAIPVDTIIEVCQLGTGTVTLAPADGTVILRSPDGKLSTRVQYSTVSLRKRATNTWLISGDIA